MTFRTFRDPASSVEVHERFVLRYVRPEAADFVRSLLVRPELQREIKEGRLVSAQPVRHDDHNFVLRHEKISPVTYPHEWPPALLRQAGRLILHIARLALDIGLGLKDATPYNVQFSGCRPVFVDWTSFEHRDVHDPLWRPLAQFSGTILLPLLAWHHTGLSPALFFLASREGLTPEQAARLIPVRKRLFGSSLRYITLPVMLAPLLKPEHYGRRSVGTPEKASFALRHLLNRLEKDLNSIQAGRAHSGQWVDYMKQGAAVSYSQAALAGKSAGVEKILADLRPQRILDIGCNTGHFSVLAARAASSAVVAIDQDVEAVDALAVRAINESLPILPLHVSISNPTPPLGWCNSEFSSFKERMEADFDLVMMLALIHHLEISERVPLRHVLSLASKLSRKYVLIEFIPLDDPMAKQLLRGRECLHQYWTRENFERTAAGFFDLRVLVPVPESSRLLYLMEKR